MRHSLRYAVDLYRDLRDTLHLLMLRYGAGSLSNRMRVRYYSSRLQALGKSPSFGWNCRIEGAEHIRIGDNFAMGEGSFLVTNAPEIVIGNRVSLNTNVHINACLGGRITIGNNCLFGPNVVLRSANHRYDDVSRPIREQGHQGADIIIEDDVWLSANVVVLPGVRIGKGCVIGAGAVVTQDIDSEMIAAGVPARAIKKRGVKD